MSTVSFGRVGLMSSGEIQVPDAQRAADVEARHQAVVELLKAEGFDGLLLQSPDNIAWFTAGADCLGIREGGVALFITRDARVVLCSNVDSGELFDQQISGLGFQLKERPWHESRRVLIEDMCRGRKVASDNGFPETTCVREKLAALRLPLSERECEQLRSLGRAVAHAVEATCRNMQPRETEQEIAGQVAHRLLKRGVQPVRIQVWADGQGHRYRHWAAGEDRVERFCTVAAVGRRNGLYLGCSRTMSFGDPPEELKVAHSKAMLIQATAFYFSKAEWELFETWCRIARIFEKFGYPDEWQLAEQGEVVGYTLCEESVTMKSQFVLRAAMPVHWHPSVGPALAADSILVTGSGPELLTPMETWPRMTVDVKKSPIHRPDILRR